MNKAAFGNTYLDHILDFHCRNHVSGRVMVCFDNQKNFAKVFYKFLVIYIFLFGIMVGIQKQSKKYNSFDKSIEAFISNLWCGIRIMQAIDVIIKCSLFEKKILI